MLTFIGTAEGDTATSQVTTPPPPHPKKINLSPSLLPILPTCIDGEKVSTPITHADNCVLVRNIAVLQVLLLLLRGLKVATCTVGKSGRRTLWGSFF